MATRADQRGWGPGWPNCQADKYVKVVLSNGVRVIARREIAELAKLLFEDGIRRGYLPRDGQTWGASCRSIKGTNTPSNHSWALAFDINSLANPQRRPLTTDMPRWYIEMWKSYGFRWGGDYISATPDSMHFEYMGTPQSAVIDTTRARARLAAPGHQPVPVPPAPLPQEDDMPTGYAVPCPAGALNEKGEQSHVATFVPLPVLGSLNGMWHGGWVSFASDFGGTTLRLAFGMDGKVTREISDFVLEPGIRRKGVPIEANEAVCSVINKGPGDVTAWVEAF